MNRRALSLALLLVVPASPAQDHSRHAPAVPKPAALLPGLGTHHHPISTPSARAQKFFDQGLTLIFAFNHEEAARSFRRAAELDPEAALPHWGLALALGANYNDAVPGAEREQAAYEAIQRAQARANKATERERAYIEALAKRFSPDPQADRQQLAADYARAMGAVVERFPDDLDAATLYAESLMMLRPWQLWDPEGRPEPGTEQILAVLESVLRRDPNHPGANHFYIHAVEASGRPERALPSAGRLRRLVPGAGHLVHMPAHIYFRTGDYESAARSNERAARADQEYARRTGATSGMYPQMYYGHNLHFLAVARAEQGRFEQARLAADRIARHAAPGAKQMPMLDGFVATPLFVLLRFQRWEEILATPEPAAELQATRAIWHFARAVALAARDRREEARREERAFAAARKEIPADRTFVFNNPAEEVMKVAAAVLDARLAGDDAAAVEHWRRAVAAQDALIYDEPPAWYYPVRESLGGALLRSGRPAEAEKVFRENLGRNPRSPRSLFGLWHTLKAQGKAEEAELVRRQFEAAWKGATLKLRVEDL